MLRWRPEHLVLVCGTGTGVGKTWVSCRLAERLRRAGVRVEARKPTQSHDPDDNSPTDAQALAAATHEAEEAVCPASRTYPVAMAPPMAADALGRRPLTTAELADALTWGPEVAVGIVETAGGVHSPLGFDGDTVDYARLVQPEWVLLVADAGLGTINAVRSVVPGLAEWPLAVLLNRFDPTDDLHRRNRDWLAERDGLPIYTDLIDVGLLRGI